MRINKRYLAGFGVFAVTAGLYGIVAFRSYSQLQIKKTFSQKAPQAGLFVPQSPEVVAAEPSGQPVAEQVNASPNINSAPSPQVGVFVGPPTAAEKAIQDRAQKPQAPQAAVAIPEVKDEAADASNHVQAKDVYGPEDQSITTNWKLQKPIQASKVEVEVKPVADEVASDFDVIASADQAVSDESQPDSRESWLKSLGISMKQFRVIQGREERLAKEVKEAQKDGADGSKDLLVTEYQEWLREYLGPDRYVRFSELAAK